MKKTIMLAALAMALCLGPDPAPAAEGDGLDIRDADGTPVLWDNGMPHFSRFDQTDHPVLDLSGVWKFKPDPDDRGIKERWYAADHDDSDWFGHPVPGSWNAQKDEWLYYQGAGWYRTAFDCPAYEEGRFYRLVLDGVSYLGEVYLNGKYIGGHHGGFTRWSLDVTDNLNHGAENALVVRVDNRRDYDSLPALKSDDSALGWWFYGGIHRPVFIESSPETTLCKLAVDTGHLGGIQAEGVVYRRGADRSRGLDMAPVTVKARLLGPGGEVLAELFEKELRIGGSGIAGFRFSDKVDGVEAWSTVTPGNRYLLEVEVREGELSETQSVEIGFRTFEFRGLQAYLNGKPVYLRGINRHEDYPESGPALSDARVAEDMKLLRELHVNFMRPAHYPNDPRWLDACDREGILVTHEIPYYQLGGSWKSAKAVKGGALLANASKQLIEMIERDRNHPSVVMWSVGNENFTYNPAIKNFTGKLIGRAKSFDPERPVTFAMNSDPVLFRALEITVGLADVIFVNEYFGWYIGKASGVGSYLDRVHQRWPNKPIVVSEFGAGAYKEVDGVAKYPIGATAKTFTYEYQEELYRTQIGQILGRDYITGVMPWIFADFRDDKRPANPRKDFNLKGVVTYEREPKDSFHYLADTYGDIGRRYAY